MSAQTVSPGRIVTYVLNDADAQAINADERPSNRAAEGDEYPAIVVRTWGSTPGSSVQLQVFIDGGFAYWATSRVEGDGPGKWHWPVRT